MNGLTLRISKCGGNKSKNSIGFSPVNIQTSWEDTGENNELMRKIIDAATTDEQLAVLKTILDQNRDTVDSKIINILVVLFFHAEHKHPIKCYISRYITKTGKLQEPFTEALANQVTVLATNIPKHYKQYVDVVSKIVMCIENFNPGVAAIRSVEVHLATYLKNCLEFCIEILSENKTLSPTEKNEIFTLTHLCLRLLLHIIQKGNDDSFSKLIHMFNEIRVFMHTLMFDNDVPMDTKNVCGILYLSMHVLENGPDSWIDILNPPSSNYSLVTLLKAEASQLCLYSAIVTVVSAERLRTHLVDDRPAIIGVMYKILDIGDRSSSESAFVLGVTRTLVQISKLLDKTSDKATGQSIVDALLLFAWSHLEHYMDSVRHLTAQMLATVVAYCAKLEKEGDDTALTKLLTALKSLDTTRKSYYVSVTCLVNQLGSNRVLQTWPTIIHDLLMALSLQHIQASATTALESLVHKLESRQRGELWLCAVLAHAHAHALDTTQLNILDNLLVTALKLDHRLMDYIIPYIKESCEPGAEKSRDLKCILMLLSVVRKCGVSSKLSASDDHEWKGIIKYDVLKEAAIDAVDETRILSLTLIVESPKSTEEFSAGDLSFVLYYLKYNINAQAPNFRQLTLSLMKKFIKRLEDSYKVIKRQKECDVINKKLDYYASFLDKLREQCFDSLGPGGNYTRRWVALQLLVWCDRAQLDGCSRTWKREYVEKLLLHLEDTYENNKVFALDILTGCPTDLIKNNTYSISMDIKDIFAQASSLKPTDCVSAAYKLDLLRRRLPECILQGEQCGAAEAVSYKLVMRLVRRLRDELGVCRRSVVLAARGAPMYGLVHCVTRVMDDVDPQLISSDPQWTSLISDIITLCMSVNAAVSSVVNNSSPEGHLPMDMSGVLVNDHGNSGGVMLDDGRQVTSQMVLLCAWRSVKEVSLLLGSLSSRLSIAGEDSSAGSLTCDQLALVGEHFTTLLAETKHRGAFEQAYVGFTKLLARLWRCRSARLHGLPRGWLADLTRAIASGDRTSSLCATRRSAGLPFMIQALVTTELQVQSNPKCFHECMSTLLSIARSSPCVESRSHALNILRALFRNAALDDSVAGYVGGGLEVALTGFEGDTWPERNSSTLLFSALMVRVFGVSRSRDADTLCARNRMTGRIFFLRYPHLYDFMLNKLQEVSSSEHTQVLRPSLYPVLLLLARLYPSSLEGTVSNLKLVSFIPPVQCCAASSVLKTRQLAAKAMVALISPEHYITHVHSMFTLLTRDIKRNYCHGILLQLVRLLDAKPEDLDHLDTLHDCVEQTLWLLEQAVGRHPCYLIADEYVKVLNLILWRFPSILQEDTVTKISSYLDKLIFNSETPQITSGRDVCLSNAIYLYFIVLNKYNRNPCDIVYKGLEHNSYEVILSTLNYLLILYRNFDENKCKFIEHLMYIANNNILNTLKQSDQYIKLLCKVLNNDYLECQQKSLQILSLVGDTQKYIIEAKIHQEVTDDVVIEKLFECLRNEHEKLTHVYLESLLNLVTNKLKDSSLSARDLLHVVRVVFEYSSAVHCDKTRSVVVQFVERNIEKLFTYDTRELSEEEIFELKVTSWCTIISVLEDDDVTLRTRTALALATVTSRARARAAGACACGALVRRALAADRDGGALAVVVALLDFRSAVLTDDGNDECRVFDQNERYNIFLEETVWTSNCADIIIQHHKGDGELLDYVLSIINKPVYKGTIDKLCNDNIVLFKQMVAGDVMLRNDALNPKIELFYNKLCK